MEREDLGSRARADDQGTGSRHDAVDSRQDLTHEELHRVHVGLGAHGPDEHERRIRDVGRPPGWLGRHLDPVGDDPDPAFAAEDLLVERRANHVLVWTVSDEPALHPTQLEELDEVEGGAQSRAGAAKPVSQLPVLDVVQVQDDTASHISGQQADRDETLDPDQVESLLAGVGNYLSSLRRAVPSNEGWLPEMSVISGEPRQAIEQAIGSCRARRVERLVRIQQSLLE